MKYKHQFVFFCLGILVILIMFSTQIYDYVTIPNLEENKWYTETYKTDNPFSDILIDTIKVVSIKDGYFKYVHSFDTTYYKSDRLKYHKNLKPLKK